MSFLLWDSWHLARRTKPFEFGKPRILLAPSNFHVQSQPNLIRDLSVLLTKRHSPQLPLPHVGTFTGHTRPVECLSIDKRPAAEEEEEDSNPETSHLYSADSMGVVKVWSLDIVPQDSDPRSVRGVVVEEHQGHRTGINEMIISNRQIWTGSSPASFISKLRVIIH